MEALHAHTRSTLIADQIQKNVFQKQIAFNVIPQIGDIDSQGWADEEIKIWD
jgi:aspartate-semialdehyde dehydrogenase